MDDDLQFYVTSMPSSRMADYYLGYFGGSVFFDFNNYKNGLIKLIRISFDGYGCCRLPESVSPINAIASIRFKEMVIGDCIQQAEMFKLISDTLCDNKSLLWVDALMEYGLYDDSSKG